MNNQSVQETFIKYLLNHLAKVESELGQQQRTMKFWAESYLAEHEHWGRCKWKQQLEEVLLESEEEYESFKNGELRKRALAKLTYEERKALGV